MRPWRDMRVVVQSPIVSEFSQILSPTSSIIAIEENEDNLLQETENVTEKVFGNVAVTSKSSMRRLNTYISGEYIPSTTELANPALSVENSFREEEKSDKFAISADIINAVDITSGRSNRICDIIVPFHNAVALEDTIKEADLNINMIHSKSEHSFDVEGRLGVQQCGGTTESISAILSSSIDIEMCRNGSGGIHNNGLEDNGNLSKYQHSGGIDFMNIAEASELNEPSGVTDSKFETSVVTNPTHDNSIHIHKVSITPDSRAEDSSISDNDDDSTGVFKDLEFWNPEVESSAVLRKLRNKIILKSEEHRSCGTVDRSNALTSSPPPFSTATTLRIRVKGNNSNLKSSGKAKNIVVDHSSSAERRSRERMNLSIALVDMFSASLNEESRAETEGAYMDIDWDEDEVTFDIDRL